MKRIKFKGLGISDGIVISKIYKFFNFDKLKIKKNFSDPKKEIKKFLLSLKKTKNDIIKIKKNISKTKALKKNELEIFDAHLLVLEDIDFINSIKRKIIKFSINAEYAIEKVSNKIIKKFKNMKNVYFKERAKDIIDVSNRLKSNILNIKIPDLLNINSECIIVANDLTPSDTAQLNKNFIKGIVTEIGGKTTHTAIIAKSLNIPTIVGTKKIFKICKNNDGIILDSYKGIGIINPNKKDILFYLKRKKKFINYLKKISKLKYKKAFTKDNHRIELGGNISTFDDINNVLKNGGESIGLYRTEFLYMNKKKLPNENIQYKTYKKILKKMYPKKVIIRTLDIGGDKNASCIKFSKEINPFLGNRAIRFCLYEKKIFITQIKALLKASIYGNLSIMFPMISTIEELEKVKNIIKNIKKTFLKKNIPFSNNIKIGIMIEIPATAIMADIFAKKVDFFSIGTNDLIQYTMAIDRMNEKVSYLYDPYNISILRLIKKVIESAHKAKILCGMCGEMASDPIAVPLLIGLGIDELSMSSSEILKIKNLIKCLNYKKLKILSTKILNSSCKKKILSLLNSIKIKKY